ncbi:MAG: putative DNA-binding domain-containing protein [Rhodocyclaceae bacterium]|nr:putative DNA-binding domain-containing protein [Rhodocyclaceae bacterium]MBP6110088.1 putative DNA-binding domain-containing protein [Rhodocyclaceae bacterium]
MHALPEIQSRFYAAMMLPQSESALEDLLQGQTDKNARRIAAYRRNVTVNLCTALALTYPVTQRIVGDTFFREAARLYASLEPSRSGDLNDYGANFANFIEGYPHAAELPYLADVARLEWQLQVLALAADVKDLATTGAAPFAALATTPPDRYDALFFECDSAAMRMNSTWPLDEIWRVNQADFAGDMQVDFTQSCQLLLWRTAHGAQLSALSKAEAALLDELLAGRALAGAVELALEQATDFDLGACLQRWIAAGVLRGAFSNLERS